MEGADMDELNFDELLDDASEIEQMADPVIEEVEIEPVDAYEEDTGLKIKPFVKEENDSEWQAGNLENQFWSYSYEDSNEVAIAKKNKKYGKAIGLVVLVIIGLILAGIVLYLKPAPKELVDVTRIARKDEKKIGETLGLTFHNSDMYLPKVRVLNDNLVQTKADEGFAVVYINNKQQGIFFDSKKYSLYGLSVGTKSSESFPGIEFKYNKTYMEMVDYHAGKKEFYYLYNTNTSECMIVSLESKNKKIMDLGYFYDYKQILQ